MFVLEAQRFSRGVVLPLLLLSLGACTSLGAMGPSSRAVTAASKSSVDQANIKIVDVTDVVARRVISATARESFADAFGDVPPINSMINSGDVIDVAIWEAPPAALFGTSVTFGSTSPEAILQSSAAPPQRTSLPPMMVDSEGMIRIPFAGSIRAAGRTPQQVEREIRNRLAGKAHDPQVIVRMSTNANAMVTVVGDVASNTRVSLTPKGERLLDVIAAAGGVNQPVGKIMVQVTRGDRVVALPLEAVIRNPSQNIRLQPDDVVTALHKPFSFTSLGAAGTSAEIPFEATGMTLAQALGRIGGLRDDRANVRGVFIFRLENPAALDPTLAASTQRTPDGRIPVIYRVDMSNPATFFIAQSFPIRDQDVVFVSSAPMTDIQKFVQMVSSMAFTVIGLGQAVP
jgi:polysaccharide export outer membrane protein